jgi:hypothetical protein
MAKIIFPRFGVEADLFGKTRPVQDLGKFLGKNN